MRLPQCSAVAMLLVGLHVGCDSAVALDNGLAIKPPRGWRSWNFFAGAISDVLIRGQVEAMLTKRPTKHCSPAGTCTEIPMSLVDLGYEHAGIDDGWQACNSYTVEPSGSPAFHDAAGKANVNATLFPDFHALTTYAAARRVQLGFYINNCICHESASHIHNKTWENLTYFGDIDQIASANFSGVKIDNCGLHTDMDKYAKLMNDTGKAFVVEHVAGDKAPTNRSWCPFNMFRTSNDIHPSWGSIMNNLHSTQRFLNGVDLRNESQMSKMWAYISNQEALRVNEQWVGDPGRLLNLTLGSAADDSALDVNAAALNSVEVWAKLQPSGAVALLAINTGEVGDADIAVDLSQVAQQITLPMDRETKSSISHDYEPLHRSWCSSQPCAIRDIWQQKDAGQTADGIWSVTALGPHDSAFVLISPLNESDKIPHRDAEDALLAASQRQLRNGVTTQKTNNLRMPVLPLKTDEQLDSSLSSGAGDPAPTVCTDDASCSFNGICTQQQCECDSGWQGIACEQLELEDAAGTGSHFTGATAGLNLLSPFQNWTSTFSDQYICNSGHMYSLNDFIRKSHWILRESIDDSWIDESEIDSHRPIYIGGRYLGWQRCQKQRRKLAHVCSDDGGINAWLQNSVVLHAVSPTATGAYAPKQIIAPVFSHEPIAVIAPTGEIVVFYTTTVPLHHTPTIAPTCTDCTGGNSSMDCAPDWDARGRNWSVPLPTYMMWTKDPTAMGAWSQPVEIPSTNLGIDPMVDTNFAPVILSNGSLVGVTRTGSITFASDWRQPNTYKCILKNPHFEGFGEDPNMWLDAKGRYHILTHANGGRHFFSSDARSWSAAPTGPNTQAYPLSANFTDGTAAPYGRRERPHLVFDGASPVALTSAVTMPPTKKVGHPKQLNRWPDASFTFLQPIKHGQ